MESVPVKFCMYVLSNTQATFEALYIEKLSNTEVAMKKRVAYAVYSTVNPFISNPNITKKVWFNKFLTQLQ